MVMFIKKWHLIFLYNSLMDWGPVHLTIEVGTGGGAFVNKNSPGTRKFIRTFSNAQNLPGGCLRLEKTAHNCCSQFMKQKRLTLLHIFWGLMPNKMQFSRIR